MEEEKGVIELNSASVVEGDIIKRIETTGVKGLNFEKAKELGLFTRISYLLCATHASVMAAYRIYGGVDFLIEQLQARKNEIAREMNLFDKAFDRFVRFWTDYYAHAKAGMEVNEESETLYRHIMEWAQLPYHWELGDKQRVDDSNINVAIRINNNDKMLTFHTTTLKDEVLDISEETWCVTKYDTKEHRQVTVESGMDKASAMMVAKRLSKDDTDNIYTASMVQEVTLKQTIVTPYKAYKGNETIGRLTKEFR